jgi:hypothetical protein
MFERDRHGSDPRLVMRVPPFGRDELIATLIVSALRVLPLSSLSSPDNVAHSASPQLNADDKENRGGWRFR